MISRKASLERPGAAGPCGHTVLCAAGLRAESAISCVYGEEENKKNVTGDRAGINRASNPCGARPTRDVRFGFGKVV